MSLREIEGDLIELFDKGYFDFMVHGCNCFCTMKSGIAKQIADRWPSVAVADKRTVKGDIYKLGEYGVVIVENNSLAGQGMIVNAYTQFYYGYEGKVYVDESAVSTIFSELNNQYKNNSYRFGIPKIGCGLAGGDWKNISKIISKSAPDIDITVVNYVK